MIDPNLANYIKKSLENGFSESDIKASLQANGWRESDIAEAIRVNQPAMSIPKPPVAPVAEPVKVVNPSPVMNPIQAAARPVVNKPSLFSIYSIFLAVVLFFGLLILADKVIRDVNTHFYFNITGQLIFDALIIVPFLIVAFALHTGLGDRGMKYRILSQPYYLVSGWLLIKLLFNVARYIYSTVAVYGVYFVLILVIVVLTAAVFFTQKFMKTKQ